MKYLLVLLVVLVAVWVWRHNRAIESDKDTEEASPSRPQRNAPPASAAPAPMLACRHCGVHLPAGDAVSGKLGGYCSAEHRRLNEGA